ncbi:rod shape-determining protein RodA [uncultured Clostridium sp.]|jgi:rod shape determining protein RodA|uniref:rod shape-determining protein RodA n=1 Tax=uncultured Clostridium sp. TaxID=59620 RepID=UPI002609EC83|nr:rod shape-determining protein RodA [uncultured Clostridium sp.]
MFRKLKLDPRLWREMNKTVLFTALLIACFGIFNIYLATYNQWGFEYALKQGVFFGISLIVMYIILVWDYTVIYDYVEIFYWFSIFLLFITRFIGTVVNGARGWIELGPVSIQPSEIAKIAMIMMIGKQLQKTDGNINGLKNFIRSTIYAGIPMALIIVQPDMGMTLVCFFMVLGIYFCMGLNMKVILGGFAVMAVTVALVWNSGFIKQYQKSRLVGFMHPERDELGINLQLNQSMIGIGSGGFFGIGPEMNVKGGGYAAEFVPERQTDFIFTVIGEHWGTMGAIVLLVLYFLLISGIIDTARKSKDVFGRVICVGIASYFIFAILQNIGMTIGLMPITGITLPMVSYGGSSLLTTLMTLGLVLNISMRKNRLNF